MAVAAGYALCFLLIAGCDGPCGNQEVQRMASPTGEWTAISFNRDCGATTKATTQVSILRRTASLPNEPGNVLVLEGQSAVKLSLSSADELLIELPPGAKWLKQEAVVNGIRVRYR